MDERFTDNNDAGDLTATLLADAPEHAEPCAYGLCRSRDTHTVDGETFLCDRHHATHV